MLIEVRELQLDDGSAPFADWFDGLPAGTANRVMISLRRIRQGNLGDWRSVGDGVHEHRIHSGSGIRLYFGRDGRRILILLGGGSKRRQAKDIRAAKNLWKVFGEMKRGAGKGED